MEHAANSPCACVHGSFLAFAAVAIVVAGCARAATPELYSGTVRTDAAAIGSEVGGRVVAVRIVEGSRVRAGDVVVRFDDAMQRAELARALADLRRAEAQEALLRAGTRASDLQRAAAAEDEARNRASRVRANGAAQLASARADVSNARAALARARAADALAETELARDTALVRSGDLARATLDTAASNARQTRAQRAAATAALAAAQRVAASMERSVPADVAAADAALAQARASHETLLEGARPDELAAAHAQTNSARAQVDAARVRLAHAIVYAPYDGVVEDLSLHPGDLVAPDVPIATLTPDRDPYVRIYVPQSRLGRFALNARVVVRSDAFPSRTFDGAVEQIDTRAQFTPRNVQTAEDRADVEFGVKVRIRDPQRIVRAGTTAEVSP